MKYEGPLPIQSFKYNNRVNKLMAILFLPLSSSSLIFNSQPKPLNVTGMENKDEDQFNHPLNAESSLSEPVTPSYSDHKNKYPRKGTSFAFRIREHVRLGPRFSETVKGKLNLIKKGGREKIFKDIFGLSQGEKLLKASQCYLSTTAGPIAGNLFISSQKIGFLSERSITVHSSSGGIIRTPYKLSIPLKKIKGANESENVNNPSQKYIEIVTHDNFEFWFLGFVRYEKALNNLQTAISMST